MSSMAISERIKCVQKCKNLDEIMSRINDLEKLYIECNEVRGKEYDSIERKADILRIAPKELQQRLQLDIDNWDEIALSTVLSKVNNYIRSMSTGRANMDLSTLDTKTGDEEGKEPRQEEDATESDPYGLSYIGGKGGKSGGKGGKGDDRKDNKKSDGYCNQCWKCGHKAADCFSNPKIKGKGKGKDGAGGKGGYPSQNPYRNQWGPAKGKSKGKGISGLEAWEQPQDP